MPKALRPLVLPLPCFPSFSFEFLPAHARLPSHPHLAKIFLLTALYWRPGLLGEAAARSLQYTLSPIPDDMPYICASQDALKVETTPFDAERQVFWCRRFVRRSISDPVLFGGLGYRASISLGTWDTRVLSIRFSFEHHILAAMYSKDVQSR